MKLCGAAFFFFLHEQSLTVENCVESCEELV